MEKTSKRLFVGNLTGDTSENDLQKAFGRYGNIQSVELKEKPNLVDPQNPTHFAFITIVTDDFSINKCLNRFSEKDLNGQFLTVSLARESFLDKLKKEREETENKKSFVHENGFNKISPKIKYSTKNDPISKHSSAKKKTFDSDDEIFNDDGSNYYNGLVKEDSPKKPLDDNEKRIESLKKMNESYENKKLLIQKALSGEIMVTNKIKFDFYESDDEPAPKKKVDLFQNSDNDDVEDENVNLEASIKYKKQFESKAGQKLLKVQSKFNADPRFKMDTNFLEEEDNDETSNETKDFKHKIIEENDDNLNENKDNAFEKETQIRIMEEIVGKKLTRLVDPNKKNHLKAMIRYDPKNEEHQEIINSIETTSKNKKKKPSDLKAEISPLKTKKKEEPNLVSQDQYYTIDDTFKESLNLRGDGFSLLSMFGRKDDENFMDNSKIENEKHNNEKILAKSVNLQILVAQTQENPFNFDSSDSEDDENSNENTNETIIKKLTDKEERKRENSKNSGKKTKSGVWMENLFIAADDKRLKEGAEFFTSRKQKEIENGEEKEDYGQTMEKLRKIINKKISKSKKSMETKHIFKKNRKSKNKNIK